MIALLLLLISPHTAQAASLPDQYFAKIANVYTVLYEQDRIKAEVKLQESYTHFYATVTAYNTVEAQTDSTPCQAAGGYICGRTDVAACPQNIALGSYVKIGGRTYQCMDRTASKFNGRFDISFDKDLQAAKNFGRQYLPIIIL